MGLPLKNWVRAFHRGQHHSHLEEELLFPALFIIDVKDDQQLIVLERVQSAVNNMAERSMLKITIIYIITTTLIPRLLNVSLLLPKV